MDGNLKLNDMEVVMVFFFSSSRGIFLSEMGIVGMFCGQVAALDYQHRAEMVKDS